jgi:tRNA pseudouridine38-40 synthase
MKKRFYYLIKVQYLGFRYHGWQKQPNGLKTVEGMLLKTLKFILEARAVKILGAGRTDALVSANETFFELFLYDEPLENTEEFLKIFNKNLPPDIKVNSIVETNAEFNIIQHAKMKEYIYLFSFGEKNHPFCASLMTNVHGHLDINSMKTAAKLFEGYHYFKTYCTQPNENKQLNREVVCCEIKENKMYAANFFPTTSFLLRVKGKGFMRNQVRLMMGALFSVGKGELTLEDIRLSLLPESDLKLTSIAPASGLILNSVAFDDLCIE